jgi:hypothetical protein
LLLDTRLHICTQPTTHKYYNPRHLKSICSGPKKKAVNAKQSALGFTQENTAEINIANGYAGLGIDGKLISTQLPDITISDTFVTASQAAMLALITNRACFCNAYTDLNKSFILKQMILLYWQVGKNF